MRFELRRIFLSALVAAVVVFGALPVLAQDAPPPPQDPSTAALEDAEAPATDEAVEMERPRRHPGVFGVAVGVQNLIPIHILKEEISDMNDLTAAGLGFGGGLRIYILDGLALTADYRRGGMSFVDNKEAEMDLIRGQLDDGSMFNSDTYLKLDGFSFGVTTFIGDHMSPDSRFNPFVSLNALVYDWSVTADDRDGALLSYQDEPIEGTDVGMSFGFGTEYKVAKRALIELGLSWHYLLTGDEILFDGFQAPNKSFYWTNTHWWGLSGSLVFGF
jgi:opacity protein-like surface antigen